MDTGENFEVNAEILVIPFCGSGTFPTTKSSGTYQLKLFTPINQCNYIRGEGDYSWFKYLLKTHGKK